MLEKKVEAHLVKKTKAAGGERRKIKFLDRNGAPDDLLLFPQGELYWVETKRPGKGAEAHQLREHKRMRKMGQHVLVLDTIESVDEFFEDREMGRKRYG